MHDLRHSLRAHPRAGGENARRGGPITSGPGSSPRGRGKRALRVPAGIVRRLIPARAGKTKTVRKQPDSWGAHPRAGGENLITTSAGGVSPGSSPRGRGKLCDLPGVGGGQRLIPARAGKTNSRRFAPPRDRAHPRAGGENGRFVRPGRASPGSSPRGRGKQALGRVQDAQGGLIPARAGKTCPNSAP